ncbi:hypothetical protein RHMOL_Rhmol07G0126200 [Rhododendron molle]|uniref:Uncharacterized protein n=1 Tax=Rhododendron molle TaxID=49168 RepID=A0ACC0N094_RHOML|nr:hypothetical protein RHMOL_Rhmol07G0126200 [Rhododendron molle]
MCFRLDFNYDDGYGCCSSFFSFCWCCGGDFKAGLDLNRVEACERLTTLGNAINLVTYLRNTMHLGNAASANTVTNFLGTSFMLCLLGGFVADTYLGRTRFQITFFNILTISTAIQTLQPPKCPIASPHCAPATTPQLLALYTALYHTALGTGGLKSSVSGLGSDQFNDTDKREQRQMTRFFNWFFFFISIGLLGAVTILVYVQDNLGRLLGYGICACTIAMGLVVFLSGTMRYRFKKLVGSPLTQITVLYVYAWRNRRVELPEDSSMLFDSREYGEKKKQELPVDFF